MKTKILYLLLLASPTTLNAQIITDYFGMPTEGALAPVSETRFVGDDMPVTEVVPTVAFPSPTTMPSGIAWDGTYLWVCGYNEYKIFCVNQVTGDTIKTIPLNIQRPYGIAYYDSSLYILDTQNKLIVTLSYSGTISDTINLLDFGNIIFPTGLYVSNDRMWFNDTKGAGAGFEGDSTLYISSQLWGFPAYADFPSGIAFDGEYMWVTDNFSQSTAKIDKNDYGMVERFSAPGGAYPNGLAWGDNGLWYVNNSSDSIYFVPHVTTSKPIIESEKTSAFFYPNPANDVLYLSPDYPDRVFILDATGRVVAENDKSSMLSVANLSSGVYFVHSGSHSEKLIISR